MLVKKRKLRQKPLYKKFIRLRENVQYRRKIFRFKKRKWKGIISHLRRIQNLTGKNYYRKHFTMHDQNRFFVRRYNVKFKKKYKFDSHVKKRLSLHYGNLLEKYMKNLIAISVKKSLRLHKKCINPDMLFLEKLESRLDTILYRSRFAISMRTARQLISHGHVYVNNTPIRICSYLVKEGDLIEMSTKICDLINYFVRNTYMYPISPKYLQICYQNFRIIVIEKITNANMSQTFPFWLDLQTAIKEYKY